MLSFTNISIPKKYMKQSWQEFREQMLAQITNPLGNTKLLDLVDIIVNGLVTLATPIVILMVIYAGFLFVSAQGNVEKLEQAKRAIMYSLIGALILLGAVAISSLIGGTVESLRP